MNYNAEIPIYLQVIHDLKKKMIQGKDTSRREASIQQRAGGSL